MRESRIPARLVSRVMLSGDQVMAEDSRYRHAPLLDVPSWGSAFPGDEVSARRKHLELRDRGVDGQAGLGMG
jgi:hypothetical protein